MNLFGTDKKKLEEILEEARHGERLIMKNRNLTADEQILAFGEVLSKIKEIVWR
jgi:hypothetical protein